MAQAPAARTTCPAGTKSSAVSTPTARPASTRTASTLAEAVAEPARHGRREPAKAHLLRVGNPPSGSKAAPAMPSVEISGIDGLELPGVEVRVSSPRGLEQRDVAATRVDQLGRHREQVAAAHEAGVGDAHLVRPMPDRPRALDGEAGSDRIGVVAAHHRERAAGVPLPGMPWSKSATPGAVSAEGGPSRARRCPRPRSRCPPRRSPDGTYHRKTTFVFCWSWSGIGTVPHVD